MKPKQTFKKINRAITIVMIIAATMFNAGCKKETLKDGASSSANQEASASPSSSFTSPWLVKSIGVSVAHWGIVEMSAPDQTTCYGQFGGPIPTIAETHDGGDTWQPHTITGLQNNFILDVSSATAQKAHVIGWNYAQGGGNVFRTEDGGTTWQQEGANAFANPASFPDVIHFFNPDNGVIFGDPPDGYFEIYTTSDGGDSWSRISSANIPTPLPNEFGLSNLADAHDNTIWVLTLHVDTASGVGMRLLQSDDKGQHWYVRNAFLPYDGFSSRIKFRNESTGLYDNSGKLYRTTDGGTTWTQVNYSGVWHNGDFDNLPGKPGVWISAGGNSFLTRFGSSISYDDGDHWTSFADTALHICVNMTSPIHGYSGGVTTAGGNDGVFVYSLPPGKLPD